VRLGNVGKGTSTPSPWLTRYVALGFVECKQLSKMARDVKSDVRLLEVRLRLFRPRLQVGNSNFKRTIEDLGLVLTPLSHKLGPEDLLRAARRRCKLASSAVMPSADKLTLIAITSLLLNPMSSIPFSSLSSEMRKSYSSSPHNRR